MSQPRSAEFSLLQAIQTPSFTPRQRDAAALWQLLLDGADLGLVVAALTRLGPTGAAAGLSRMQAEQGAARALLVRALRPVASLAPGWARRLPWRRPRSGLRRGSRRC